MRDAPHPMLARLWRHAAAPQGARAQAGAAQALLAGLGTAVSALPLLADPLAALRASPWAPVGGQPADGLDAALAALHQQALAQARATASAEVDGGSEEAHRRTAVWPGMPRAAAASPAGQLLPGGMPGAAPGTADARRAGRPAPAHPPAAGLGRALQGGDRPAATAGTAAGQAPGAAAVPGADSTGQAWPQRLARSALDTAFGPRLPPARHRPGPAAAAGAGSASDTPGAAPDRPAAAARAGLARLAGLTDALAGGLAAALPAMPLAPETRMPAPRATAATTTAAAAGAAGGTRPGPGEGPTASWPATGQAAHAEAWHGAGPAAAAWHAGAGAAAATGPGAAALGQTVAQAGSLEVALAGRHGGPGGFRGLAARAAGGAGNGAAGLSPDAPAAPAAADAGTAGWPAASDDALLEQLARALRREAERDGIDLGGQRA